MSAIICAATSEQQIMSPELVNLNNSEYKDGDDAEHGI
jgi:hypothetical protein